MKTRRYQAWISQHVSKNKLTIVFAPTTLWWFIIKWKKPPCDLGIKGHAVTFLLFTDSLHFSPVSQLVQFTREWEVMLSTQTSLWSLDIKAERVKNVLSRLLCPNSSRGLWIRTGQGVEVSQGTWGQKSEARQTSAFQTTAAATHNHILILYRWNHTLQLFVRDPAVFWCSSHCGAKEGNITSEYYDYKLPGLCNVSRLTWNGWVNTESHIHRDPERF